MGDNMLNMLIVDDEYLVRMGVRNTIDWENYGIEIIDEAEDGAMGLELALKYNPDIILTDIRMPYMDGLEFMSKIRESGIESSIIVLSGYDEFDYVRKAMHNGAYDYILKPIDNQQLIATVQKVAQRIKEDKSKKQYFSKLQEELSTIKRQFIRDLVLGNINDKEHVLEKIKFLDLPIDTDNISAIVIKIENVESLLNELTQSELGELKDEMLKNIANLLLLHTRFIGVVVDMSLDEWVILIHSKKVDDITEKAINDRCIELLNKVKKELPFIITIGIGSQCNEIIDIHDQYIKVKETVGDNALPNTSTVVKVGESLLGYRREVKEAICYINEYYGSDITIEALANKLFISSSYLMHIFKQEVGKTFNEYLIDVRIQKAKELLKDPRYKIYEVCQKVGYNDPKYFSQIFKKVVGISPSEFVRK